MKFVKSNIFFLCFLLLNNECLSAPEPLCSKFPYEVQLLEKMVRMEFNVNYMEKNMLATEKNMLGTEKNMLETQNNVENTLKMIDDKIKQLEEKEATFMENINSALAGKETKQLEEKEATFMESINTALAERQDDRVVAFHAHKAADRSLVNNQVIVFTKVSMNEGDGYDNSNGYFTAPVRGVYHFTSHLCGNIGKYLEYILVVNDKKWASGLYKANASGTCTSFSVTVQMQSGERAWVTIDDKGSSSTDLLFEDSDDWNYFSGFLINQMD